MVRVLRVLPQIILVALFGLALSAANASHAEFDPRIEGLADPGGLEAAIAEYDGFPEAQQAAAIGGIIGQLAAMFRSYPDRTDEWISSIENKRVATFAVIALGLAGDPAKAKAFAARRDIGSADLLSVLLYPGGDRFPSSQAGWAEVPLGDILGRNGTLEQMRQELPWHQDVVWAAALVWQDGAAALPILRQMDALFETLDIEPSELPGAPDDAKSDALKPQFEAIRARDGDAAAWRYMMSVAYLASGAWSFASNNRHPFVLEDFEEYAAEHPESAAVEAVRNAMHPAQ